MPPSLSKWISAGKKNQVQSSPGGSASTRGNSPSSLESEGTPLPIPDPENDDAAMGMDGGGSQGVATVLQTYTQQLYQAMIMTGCPDLSSIDGNILY